VTASYGDGNLQYPWMEESPLRRKLMIGSFSHIH
jgi:hypothetical protein